MSLVGVRACGWFGARAEWGIDGQTVARATHAAQVLAYNGDFTFVHGGSIQATIRGTPCHCCDNHASHSSRSFDRMGIGKVNGTRRGAVPSVTRQPSDQRQVFSCQDCLTGGGMPRVRECLAFVVRVSGAFLVDATAQHSRRRACRFKWMRMCTGMSSTQCRSERLAIFPALANRQVATEAVANTSQGGTVDIRMDPSVICGEKLRMPLKIGPGQRFDHSGHLGANDGPELVGRRRRAIRGRRLAARRSIAGIRSCCRGPRRRTRAGIVEVHPFADDSLAPFVAGVGLHHETVRLRTPGRLDTEKMDPNSEGLRHLDADLDVLVAGQDQRVGDRMVSREFDKVRPKLALSRLGASPN